MKTKQEIINKFNEFNKEVTETCNLSFKDKIHDSWVKFCYSKIEGTFKFEAKFPDDESIKAFCNDIRKYIQSNDSLKIEKLNEFYNKSDMIEQEEDRMFNKEMSKINKFMKMNSNHVINGKNYTHEEILEIFLYGKISHRTKGQKETYDNLEKNWLYPSLKNQFINILNSYLILIKNLMYINNEVIKKLK